MKLFVVKTLIINVFVLFVSHLHSQSAKITFAPQWMPQAQFAGYYVAQQMGFYKEAGLEVEIIHPSANIPATDLLSSGKVDVISLFLITGMSAKNNGIELVNIAQLSQHSAIFIVTKKSSGIDRLEKLKGKKIGVWKSGFDEVPKAMMKEKNYDVEWIPILFSVNLFMLDGIDAMTVMSYNEYDNIINCGVNEDELNVFPISDYGYDVPEDGLYCLNATYNAKKEELKRFVEATFRGWEYASANKTEAIDIVLDKMKAAHIPANRVHQDWMLDRVLEMMKGSNKSKDNGSVKKGELLETDFNHASKIFGNSSGNDLKYTFEEFYRPPNQ
jgi:NitT/TauT family transport system substrate-binding protein